MINLHERLSEFSYGFGVTREVQSLLEGIGLRPTPFLPNLLHEEELGFDVGFEDRGRVVILQFKLGHELKRFHRATPAQSVPELQHPFWRFIVDTSGHQFQRLTEFEASDADTYYIAPKFSDWKVYDSAFQDGKVLEKSLLLKPSEISRGVQAQGGSAGMHRIVYDGLSRYVCSEPTALRESRPGEVATEIATKIRQSKATLEEQVGRLYERARPQAGPGALARSREDRIFARSKDRTHGMAAIVGLEAWSQGAQLLFVTDASG
ncbi:hypothetical protein [Ancylobacter sp. IITR112]|uniref:hypothetical protein n=1 Tax=Ancylobacter sp. IITR112 TaxID=3138073 RepID=UPI00352A17EC